MKVLITGVAGFLGTHVAELFKKRGWEVVGIDNLTDYELKRTFNVEKSRKHNLDFLKKIGIEFQKKDVRYVNANDFKDINFIIHCAAQPTMTLSITDPINDFDNNIKGTINMLEIARKLKIPFINCSSIHVYGNNINHNLEENETRFTNYPEEFDEETEILDGDLTPLHVSKRATELYTQCYAETYGLRTASFRLTGMYGERQFGGMDHGWVANFAIRAVMQRPITIFGTDKQVRDILYAKDAAQAFYNWYQNGDTGIYNIGGGIENSISINECLKEISNLSGNLLDIKLEGERFGDLWYFVCDHKKATENFGWKPKIPPKEGLKYLIKWIKENKEIIGD